MLSKCAICRKIEIRSILIAENYAEALTRIRSLCIEGDNLDFWQKFLDLAEGKYQRQIEIDLNYLIASQDLFQQSISTVRGMVEIEQVEFDREQEDNEKKRDRQLENIIFFVGTAIGGGQIFFRSLSSHQGYTDSLATGFFSTATSLCCDNSLESAVWLSIWLVNAGYRRVD